MNSVQSAAPLSASVLLSFFSFATALFITPSASRVSSTSRSGKPCLSSRSPLSATFEAVRAKRFTHGLSASDASGPTPPFMLPERPQSTDIESFQQELELQYETLITSLNQESLFWTYIKINATAEPSTISHR